MIFSWLFNRPPSCLHEWVADETYERWLFGCFRGYRVFQTCSKCGDRRSIDL